MGLMNLIRAGRSLSRLSPEVLERLSNWEVFNHPGWGGSSAAMGVSGEIEVPGMNRAAENVLMVYACVVARREAVGGVPLKLTNKAGDEIEGGPLAALLDQPNLDMTWGGYVRALETYLSIWNMMAIAKVRDGEGLPSELIPLYPGGMTPRFGAHKVTGTPLLASWEYRDPNTGMFRTFAREDVLVSQGFNPHAPMSPLSPLTVIKRTMQQDIASREANLALQMNDATPSIVLQGPVGSRIESKQADEILDRWVDKYGGFRKKGRPGILWGGMEAKSLGISPKDMEYIAGLKFLRTDYYMVFRVKPAMVHDVSGETALSQGNSTEEQEVSWWQSVGIPELNMIAQVHQRGLVDEFDWGTDGAEMWFDENQIPALVKHRLARLDQATKLIGFGYRPDDVNQYLDLGLPEHPDNLGRVAFAQQTIGPEAGEEGDNSKSPIADSQAGTPAAVRMLDELVGLVRARKPKAVASRSAFEAFLKPREKAAARRWSRFFIEQRDRVLSRLGSLQRSAESDAAKLMPGSEDMALAARIGPVIREHMKDGVTFFQESTGNAGALTIESGENFQAAVAKRIEQAKLANRTTEKALADLLSKSVAEGETAEMLAARVADYYNAQCIGEDAHRPLTAARTETAGIVNEGQLQAAKEVGGLKKIWIHGSPKEAREAHVAAEQAYAGGIGLDEKFEVNGLECDAPGDASLPPEEVCNCTCMLGFLKS